MKYRTADTGVGSAGPGVASISRKRGILSVAGGIGAAQRAALQAEHVERLVAQLACALAHEEVQVLHAHKHIDRCWGSGFGYIWASCLMPHDQPC